MYLKLPTVSELQPDGTKIVNVYDSKNAITRNIKVSAQEADEFISTRKEVCENAIRKDKIKMISYSTLGTLGGLGLGLVGLACKKKINTNVNSKNIVKKLAKIDFTLSTLIGVITGCLFALPIEAHPSFLKQDRKLTEAFIEKHKEQ